MDSRRKKLGLSIVIVNIKRCFYVLKITRGAEMCKILSFSEECGFRDISFVETKRICISHQSGKNALETFIFSAERKTDEPIPMKFSSPEGAEDCLYEDLGIPYDTASFYSFSRFL